MWWSKKKKEPQTINWLEGAQKDFAELREEMLPKLKALNQKWFKKDTGFNLMSSRFGEQLCMTTEIEGLGLTNAFFFKAIQKDVTEYLQGKSYTEIEEFCDELKKSLLSKCYMKL